MEGLEMRVGAIGHRICKEQSKSRRSAIFPVKLFLQKLCKVKSIEDCIPITTASETCRQSTLLPANSPLLCVYAPLAFKFL